MLRSSNKNPFVQLRKPLMLMLASLAFGVLVYVIM